MRTGGIDRPGAQADQPAAADTAHQIGILHIAQSAIAADLVIETLGDQKPLVAIRQREQHGAQRRLGFGAARVAAKILQRETKHRRARTLQHLLADEGFRFHVPALLQGGFGMKKQQPIAFGRGRAIHQLGAAAFSGAHHMGAGCVGNRQGAVTGTGVGHDHFAHHAAHRGRDQAVEAARQMAFAIQGGDHDGNHDTIMTNSLRRARELPVAANCCSVHEAPVRSSEFSLGIAQTLVARLHFVLDLFS